MNLAMDLDSIEAGQFYTLHVKRVVFRKPISSISLDGSPEYVTINMHTFNGRYLKATGSPISLKFQVSGRFLAIVFPGDILVIERMNPALHPDARKRNIKGRLIAP